MEIQADQLLAADRETIWALLNDPEVLKECIPGCEALEANNPTHMTATVALKVGPVKARFNGSVDLIELNSPISYAIVGEGKGGIAGFAKGRADVSLSEQENGTLLSYKVSVNIGGKIAQLGSRLMESTARKLSEEFFTRFSEKVAERVGAPTA